MIFTIVAITMWLSSCDISALLFGGITNTDNTNTGIEIYDDRIVNPSNVDVFVTINNEKAIIYANSVYML